MLQVELHSITIMSHNDQNNKILNKKNMQLVKEPVEDWLSSLLFITQKKNLLKIVYQLMVHLSFGKKQIHIFTIGLFLWKNCWNCWKI